jgi:predicted  nucleic acid-binding Zn-ribbon protein
MTVVPVQPDEFRCGGCFLVLHRGLHAGVHRGQDICRDCA